MKKVNIVAESDDEEACDLAKLKDWVRTSCSTVIITDINGEECVFSGYEPADNALGFAEIESVPLAAIKEIICDFDAIGERDLKKFDRIEAFLSRFFEGLYHKTEAMAQDDGVPESGKRKASCFDRQSVNFGGMFKGGGRRC